MNAVSRLPLLAFAAVLAAGCDDERALVPVAPNVSPNEISAYLAVSSPSPTVGERVTVSIRARRGSAIRPIGSFTVHLTYDTTRLQFVEAARSSSGMVMANGTVRGIVKAAGASAEGFTDDELVTTSFLVLAGGNALSSLALTVPELNSLAFEDQREQMRVERRLYRGDVNKQ
jgi:hypothetical protein